MIYPSSLLDFFIKVRENFRNLEDVDFEYRPPTIDYNNPNSYTDINITAQEYDNSRNSVDTAQDFKKHIDRHIYDHNELHSLNDYDEEHDKLHDELNAIDKYSPEYEKYIEDHLQHHRNKNVVASPDVATPATETTATPAAATPATETTATPTADTPSTATPATATPATATPSTATPAADTPSTATPAADTPVATTDVSYLEKLETFFRNIFSSPTKDTKKEEDKIPNTNQDSPSKKDNTSCKHSDVFDMNCNQRLKLLLWSLIIICIFVVISVVFYIIYVVLNTSITNIANGVLNSTTQKRKNIDH